MADTLAALLRDHATTVGDRAAVVGADGRTLTYRELFERGGRRAAALLARGLRPGDRVGAWMSDGPDYVELYVACALAGLVVVPCNARYGPREVAGLLDDAQVSVFVSSPELREAATRVRELVPAAAYDDLDSDALMAMLADRPVSETAWPGPADPFVLGYTSGTTGRPKGAILTHASVLAIARLNTHSYGLPDGGTIAMTGSMSFVAVVPAHVVSHLFTRSTVLFLGEWTVTSLLLTLREHRVTFFYVASPLIAPFVEAARTDPGALDTVVSVLHSASKATTADLVALAGLVGDRLREGWGMTENSGGLMTVTTPADLTDERRWPHVLSSAGRAALETDVEVVDADDRPLPHDGEAVGELVFRSPAVMAGYWRRPEETAATLRGGWLHSGDLGSIDPDGLVRIHDRRNDLIVSGGMNVYPAEVEECILELPGVQAVGVVGVPHERWGRTVVAAVERRPGHELSEADVIAHCRSNLAGYKKPTSVLFVDALPRTPSLKISRAELRRQLTGEPGGTAHR